MDQIAGAGAVSAKKMFGEYGIYCDEKLVALVCDDRFFVKISAAGKELLGEPEQASPYPGAKPWFLVSGDLWDEHALLSDLVKKTADQLPLKIKKPRKSG